MMDTSHTNIGFGVNVKAASSPPFTTTAISRPRSMAAEIALRTSGSSTGERRVLKP